MLTNKQLSQLKEELLQLKEQFEETDEEESLRRSVRDQTGELSLYDNHPADSGTELFEREKDLALTNHSQSELDKVNNALEAMEQKNYGICEVCGNEIAFERLEVVPYATCCAEHADGNLVTDARPVEEDIIIPAKENTFSGRHRKDGIRDFEDSFQEVAQFGTSETPADFVGDFDSYEELYEDDPEDGSTEEYETFSATDITGKHREILQTGEERHYEEELDEEGMESPLGDIPYKKRDSYIEE